MQDYALAVNERWLPRSSDTYSEETSESNDYALPAGTIQVLKEYSFPTYAEYLDELYETPKEITKALQEGDVKLDRRRYKRRKDE